MNREALREHRVELVESADVIHGQAQSLVGCGDALLGQRIVIADPQTRTACGDAVVGEIWISGASIAGGYWGRDEETELTFQARLANGEGPYMRTGDLGFRADGHLFVAGRLKDVIIIRGRNHYPQDVERTACDSHVALRQDSGAVFTVSGEFGDEQVVVVHEIDRQYRKADFEEVMRAIRRSVAEVHELEVHAIILIRHMSLPRTTSGKAQRHVCRKQMQTNALKILAEWKKPIATAVNSNGAAKSNSAPERLQRHERPMTPDEIDRLSERIESWLLTWLVQRAAIPQEEVHRDKPFAEYGLDSLTAVELSQELEDWVGVEVVPTVAWNYPTPTTLSAYLAREAGGANDAEVADASGRAESEIDDEFARMLAEVELLSDADASAEMSEFEDDDSALG